MNMRTIYRLQPADRSRGLCFQAICLLTQVRILFYSTIVFAGNFAGTGDGQVLQFDTNPSVACQEVADGAFAASVPGEKLIRVDCHISVLGIHRERTLDECLFHFYSPEFHTRVQDYSPKTIVATDVVGNIQVQSEHVQSQGVRLGVEGDASNFLHANATANHETNSAENRSFEVLPPRELVTAAGTLGRGSGVYFKIRRTSQQSLEGTHLFSLILRVPSMWRAGYLRLHCQGFTDETRLQPSQMLAQSAFMIPLYLVGDTEAKQQATRLMSAEQSLIAAVREHQGAIQKVNRPSLLHEVALKSPQLPDQWLVTLLRQPANAPAEPFEYILPPEIRQQMAELRSEKQKMSEFSEGK